MALAALAVCVVCAVAVLLRHRALAAAMQADPDSPFLRQPRQPPVPALGRVPPVPPESAAAAAAAQSFDLRFSWTIFVTPQGFRGPADRTQRRAIESWLRLQVSSCVLAAARYRSSKHRG